MVEEEVCHALSCRFCSRSDPAGWRYGLVRPGPLRPVLEDSSAISLCCLKHKKLLTSMRFISCPRSGRVTVLPVLEVCEPEPDPLDGPEGEGGIGGAGTRRILELTTD
jgi:hypothetical protein